MEYLSGEFFLFFKAFLLFLFKLELSLAFAFQVGFFPEYSFLFCLLFSFYALEFSLLSLLLFFHLLFHLSYKAVLLYFVGFKLSLTGAFQAGFLTIYLPLQMGHFISFSIAMRSFT